MSFKVQSDNHLRGLAAAAFTTAATAAGYRQAGLNDGTLAEGWQASAAAATFNIDVDLGAAQALGAVSFWSAKGATTGPTQVALVEVFHKTLVGDPWVSAGTVVPNARGDGLLAVSATKRYVRWAFTMASGAEALFVGELRVGSLTTLTFAPAGPFSQGEDDHTIANESVGGALLGVQLRDYDRRLRFSWSSITEAAFTELRTIVRAARGRLYPVVVLPESSRGIEVYHGHLGDSWGWEIDFVEWRGAGFDFRESGRP